MFSRKSKVHRLPERRDWRGYTKIKKERKKKKLKGKCKENTCTHFAVEKTDFLRKHAFREK